ncbi:MAG: hypothetical protein ACI8ZM_004257 [Crocinitomix sp.]|jgi:hypothetical protein
MRFASILIISFISTFLYGQNKVYTTYTTETGMGIQLTYDNLPNNKIHTPITSDEYEFIDQFYLPVKNGRIAKNYFRFKKEGKMGILNAKGKEIIPANYDTIQWCNRFIGEGEPVFHDFFLFEKDEQVWVRRCSNLNRLFSETCDSIKYNFLTGGIHCYKNNRTKYYNNNGSQLFPKIEFESIHDVFPAYSYNENYIPDKIIAKEPGKAMCVYSKTETFTNKEGAYLHAFISEFENYTFKMLVKASKNGRMGLLDERGNTRIPFLYDNLIPIYPRSNNERTNRLIIFLNNKEGLCDFFGNIIFAPEYLAGSFSENKAYYNKAIYIVAKDTVSFQGVFDSRGKEIIPIQEQTIKEHIHNGRYRQHYFYVIRNGKKGVYSYDGNEIIPCEYYDIYDENSVNHQKSAPNFMTFKTKQEYFDYWER